MLEKTYAITIDVRADDAYVAAFKDFIRSHPSITNWWNYIPGVFLVISPLSAKEIGDATRAHTGNASLLVVEVNLANSEGLLPESAWTWINRRSRHPAPDLVDAGPMSRNQQA